MNSQKQIGAIVNTIWIYLCEIPAVDLAFEKINNSGQILNANYLHNTSTMVMKFYRIKFYQLNSF